MAALPQDDAGYRYILLMGDMFSKYIAAKPLQNQSEKKVINTLFLSWILRHGCFSYLVSDHVSNVNGQSVREHCETFSIQEKRSSAYHSQGNGSAERNIRNIREVFRKEMQK